MEIKILLLTLITIIFITENFFSKIFGLHRFINVTQKPESAIGMGLAVTFVITTASFITYVIIKNLPFACNYTVLKTISFVLIITLIGQFFKIVIRKLLPALNQTINKFVPTNKFFPHFIINCAMLGVSVAIFNIEHKFIIADIGLSKTLVQGLGTGICFTIILLLMAGIRERLEYAEIPEKLKGLPISFIVAGLLALAFCGFSGIII